MNAVGLTLPEAQAQIWEAVFQATRLLEDLDRADKLSRGGLSMRSAIADFASDLVAMRWLDRSLKRIVE